MARLHREGHNGAVRSILIALAATLWLAACSGGGGTDGVTAPDAGAPDAGTGSKSPTACDDTNAIEGGGKQKMSGVISAIGTDGHLIVGRTNFATNGASITVDGEPASLADLHQGDIVVVTGTLDIEHETGCAKALYADASIVGPVSRIDKASRSLQVLSLTIQLRDDAVLADLDGTSISLSDLNLGDTVRVSGVPSAGVIVATRVQGAPPTESYFLAGLVASLDEADRQFSINEFGVKYDASAIIDFPEGRLQEGDPVRLSGTELTAGMLQPDAIQYIDYDAPVSVFPGIAALHTNESIQFRAFVASGDPSVSWSVLDANGQPCSAPDCGSIDETGRYTASSVTHVSPGVLVRATSVADPASSDTVSVYIYPTLGGLAVIPGSVTLAPGSSQRFTPYLVTYTEGVSTTGSDMPVSWTVTGAGCVGEACGTIDAEGTYRAPEILPEPAVVTVTARGALLTGAYGSATVNLGPNSNLARLKGRYAFLLIGSDAEHASEGSENAHVMAIGSILADGAGHVTSGVEYVNRRTRFSTFGSVTGSYSINEDGRGYVQFDLPDEGVRNLTIALADVVDGVARTVRVTSHSDYQRLTGTMRRQNEADFRTSALAGDYAFLLEGEGYSYRSPADVAAAGRFTIVSGQLTAGQADVDYYAPLRMQLVETITGQFAPSVTANGEVRLHLSIAALPDVTEFAGFIISADEVLLMQADPRSTKKSPGLSGHMLRQHGGPFDQSALKGESYLCWSGSHVLMRFHSAGDGGIHSNSFYFDDWIQEWRESSTPRYASYVVAANGRARVVYNKPPFGEYRFYFVEPGKAFAIYFAGSTGMLYSKTSTATSLNGRYVLSSSASSAVLTATASGAVAGTFDAQASGRRFGGSYAFDDSGALRLVVAPDNHSPGESRYWMVSDSFGIGMWMGPGNYFPGGCRMIER